MLSELYIENLAVIEKANISFTAGLNIFTGETGAGKSILINGINAVLGQRVTKDIVRTGAEKAVISAMFTDVGKDVKDCLGRIGIECEDGQLFLTREIRSDGGSVARVNSRSINVSALREIGDLLVNIHGQHDNQILLAPEKHITILDAYSDAEPLIEDYQQAFKELQLTAKQISKLKAESDRKAYRISELEETVAEIEALKITEGEDEKIREELDISKNAVAISEAMFYSEEILSGDDDTSGVSELIADAKDRLAQYTDIFPSLSVLVERLDSCGIEVSDIASELQSRRDKLNVDPKRFDFLNSRSDELRKICKKYGPELSDVLRTLEESKQELAQLSDSDESLAKLNEHKNELLGIVSVKAKKLSEHRSEASKRFVSQVTQELEFLNMPKVKLVVEQKTGKLTINGMDQIEFLISANVGEEPRPIARIASGGELSRIMLALKNVIAEKDAVATLIFDEIDTGVSGRAALKIGQKLKQISKLRQVLCVTHLAQIAVTAENHLLIEKNIVGDRTVTSVTPLAPEDRKFEIARIMSGEDPTELMLQNAQSLIDSAAQLT
ncbi:MAG: DNA repair protein RecN [Ruminococcus sp.]|nr:DNA repair protein RecN [Ruminococcus sp.]